MTRKFMFLAAAAMTAGFISCNNQNTTYQVIADMPAEANSTMAYLVDYDNGENIDSVLVTDGKATFTGEIDSAMVVRLIVDGNRYAQLILESGNIEIDSTRKVTGSPLNTRFDEISTELLSIAAGYDSCTTEEAKDSVVEKYNAEMKRHMSENISNPIGYMFFIQQAYEMAPDELNAELEKNPALKNSIRISKLVEMNNRKAATSVGQKYLDFDIDGKKLSDYVGKDGKYLLVDFWASWCGPCIRQTAVIKDIYAKHKDKLNVLGVAVWDKPEATKRAIEQHELSWDCIINAQNIPTDLYGISGIPCIILISPDGTILSRDKQSDELKADVDKYLAQ